MGLVAVLRRQIDFNLDRQARFDVWTGEDVEFPQEDSVEETELQQSSNALPEDSADSSVDETRRRGTAIDIDTDSGAGKVDGEERRVDDVRKENGGRRPSKIAFILPSRRTPEIVELPSILYLPPPLLFSSVPRTSKSTDEKFSEDKESSSDSSTEGAEKPGGGLRRFSFGLPGSFRRLAERKREISIRDEAFSRLKDLLRAEQDVIVVSISPTSLDCELIELW